MFLTKLVKNYYFISIFLFIVASCSVLIELSTRHIAKLPLMSEECHITEKNVTKLSDSNTLNFKFTCSFLDLTETAYTHEEVRRVPPPLYHKSEVGTNVKLLTKSSTSAWLDPALIFFIHLLFAFALILYTVMREA